MQLQTATIKFPEIGLQTRDAHKLRGFFGNLFKEKSELLHNHFADGSHRYKYPLVQYKVIDKSPYLVGVSEGAKLLVELFLKIKFLNIEGRDFQINSKNITTKITELGDFSELHEYKFATLWMALNQENFKIYLNENTDKEAFLNKMLQNNILSFYKGVDFFVSEKIMTKGSFLEHQTSFKNKKMLVFSGSFVTNAVLPEFVGIGKSPARGFGSLVKS